MLSGARRRSRRSGAGGFGAAGAVLAGLAAGLLLVLPLPAQEEEVDVLVLSPRAEPAFGEVEIVAEVLAAEPIEAVEFFVDGERVGELSEPPWRLAVDVGQDNRERSFEVVAHTLSGATGRGEIVTPAIAVQDEIKAELQQLYVTVTAAGARVLDLEEADFEIVDEGRRQETVTFARGDVRIVASLLVDASTSMEGERLTAALRGAAAFAAGMTEHDDASILVFSDRLLHATPFANDPRRLTSGLAGVEASGGTALNDHLYLALKRVEHQQGRRVVVILTDGIDSHSTLRMREVAWFARRSRALVYWIRTGGGQVELDRYNAWKDPERYAEDYAALVRTVEESGGRIVDLDRIEAARGAFEEILAELREQYVLGFYPTADHDDGSWHRIKVRVKRPGVGVRSQAGYVDY